MLLQTNSYLVPPEKRDEHVGLMKRFAQILHRLGCERFEIVEQMGPEWTPGEVGRCVQLMQFRDRKHQQQVQQAEQTDPDAQAVIAEFVALLDIPYQQDQGYFASGYYESILPGVASATEHAPVHHAPMHAAAEPPASAPSPAPRGPTDVPIL